MVAVEEVDASLEMAITTANDAAGDYHGVNDPALDCDESFLERIEGLKEMISEDHRNRLSSIGSIMYDWGSWTFSYARAGTWILSTSVLLLVIPLGMEVEKEQMMVQWENEQKAMLQQQRQMLNPAGVPTLPPVNA